MRQARSEGHLRGLLAAAVALALLAAPGVATADPVSFLPGYKSFVNIKFVDHESLICAPPAVLCAVELLPFGATLQGIATATSISNPTTGTNYWVPSAGLSSSSDGTELNAIFKGLSVVFSSQPGGAGTPVETWFTGGVIDIYNVPFDGSGVFLTGASPGPLPLADQVCPGGICPAVPWLSAKYQTQDFYDIDPGAGVTLVPVTLKTTFNPGSGVGSSDGWFTLTGGTASSAFDTNFFLTPAGFAADATFNNDFQACTPFSTDCAEGWPFRSDDPISAMVNPEPTTLLLWGTSLLGIAAIGRWRRRLQD